MRKLAEIPKYACLRRKICVQTENSSMAGNNYIIGLAFKSFEQSLSHFDYACGTKHSTRMYHPCSKHMRTISKTKTDGLLSKVGI